MAGDIAGDQESVGVMNKKLDKFGITDEEFDKIYKSDQLDLEFRRIANKFRELRDIHKKVNPEGFVYEGLRELCDDLDKVESKIFGMCDTWFNFRLIATMASKNIADKSSQ